MSNHRLSLRDPGDQVPTIACARGMGMEGVSCVSTRAQSLLGHEDGRQIRPSPDPSPGVAAASGDAVTERGRAKHGGRVTATLYGQLGDAELAFTDWLGPGAGVLLPLSLRSRYE